MARVAVTEDGAALRNVATREARALSDTVARMRNVVRTLNRIASRMDRTLGKRLRQLEALHR